MTFKRFVRNLQSGKRKWQTYKNTHHFWYRFADCFIDDEATNNKNIDRFVKFEWLVYRLRAQSRLMRRKRSAA